MEIDLQNFGNNIFDENSFNLEKAKLKLFILENVKQDYQLDLLNELKYIDINGGVTYGDPFEDNGENERKNQESQKTAFWEGVGKLKNLAKEVSLYIENGATKKNENGTDFIDIKRIEEIRKIQNQIFDTSKLIKILEEINDASQKCNYITISALCRICIDHIPPIFGKDNFPQVASEVSFEKSVKASIQKLEQIMRDISDNQIHHKISRVETLPNAKTVDFVQPFDVLLQEVIKKLK